ncbi:MULTISPECIES: hypothetical protein, partial [Rhodococcus]|uniref:hypothetical protein n=2 Tax=Rhodococcus TaxID=1827 RepID=UPI001BE0F759
STKKILALTFIDTLLSSQRTRTHHHFNQVESSGARVTILACSLQGSKFPLSVIVSDFVQPRFPGLSVGVGVRVALTWTKLRE